MVTHQMTGQILQLESSALGLIQYGEAQRFHCPLGVLGFPDQHYFVLIDEPKVQPFRYLQSEDMPELSFLIIDPGLIKPGHTLRLDRSELKELHLDENDQNAIYVIASVKESPQDTTLNFRGPLVFNLTKRCFVQVVDETQELKVPLFHS
jgi:flagellar assembly factor FliW